MLSVLAAKIKLPDVAHLDFFLVILINAQCFFINAIHIRIIIQDIKTDGKPVFQIPVVGIQKTDIFSPGMRNTYISGRTGAIIPFACCFK